MSETKPIEGITLKHLSPYLPYGLKAYATDIKLIEEITLKNVEFLISESHNCKPLLRNLSDLTKEIEVNGERFVPNEWLSENMPNTPNFRYMLNASHHFDLSETIIEWCVMNKLIEWHFDVFWLLDKNLAVNINDIQK